jgi:3-oxoadipate enol-lactonase
VVGELDVITPPHLSEELHRHLPGAELHVVPGAGHAVFVEQPDAWFEVVDRFLG